VKTAVTAEQLNTGKQLSTGEQLSAGQQLGTEEHQYRGV